MLILRCDNPGCVNEAEGNEDLKEKQVEEK